MGFDLSDFAAAALRFQNDTKKLLSDNNYVDENGLSYIDQKKQEDDALARLLDEQTGLEDLDKVTFHDDDDEDLPDWANEELPTTTSAKDVKIISEDSKLKTNFLLQVCLSKLAHYPHLYRHILQLLLIINW